MKVLVTGGAGLVGSHCAEYYADKGAKVIVLDNLIRSRLFKKKHKQSVEFNWNYVSRFKNIKMVKGDVREKKDVTQCLKGVDLVIHCAGQPGSFNSLIDPEEDFSINAKGTFNVLECLRMKSPEATFIYCSTNKVYGSKIDELPIKRLKSRYEFKRLRGIDESFSLDHQGRTPYGSSKLVGDLYAQEYARSFGMRTGVFRMGCIYGTRQFGFEEQGWEAWFAIACLFNRTINIYGDGRQLRDILFAPDLVRAFDSFYKSRFQHKVYNIGGGLSNSVSLLEYLGILEKETGIKPRVKFLPWRDKDQRVYVSDIARVENELGWKPKTGVREGTRKLITWIKENKQIFKGEKYG